MVGSYADAVIVGSAFIRAIETPGPAGALQATLLAQRLADDLHRPLPAAAA